MNNFFTQTKLHKNISFDDFDTSKSTYEFLCSNFSEELSYIKSLPIIVEDDKHLYVHGGYDESFSPKDVVKFLKYDNFNQLSKVNHKYVVVGHWPTCNLRTDKIDNKPYFNHEKNIIFIDGGLGVKSSGELNCLIINKNNSKYSYESIQFNDFKKSEVIEEHTFDGETNSEEGVVYFFKNIK